MDELTRLGGLQLKREEKLAAVVKEATTVLDEFTGVRPEVVSTVLRVRHTLGEVKLGAYPRDAAGDVMLAAVWVRKTGPGDASLPLLMLESQTEPKTVIARSADVALGDAWTLVYASGTAPTAFGAGETSLILHLGRDAGTLEIGPGLLFDMGADYDVARLPTNPPAP